MYGIVCAMERDGAVIYPPNTRTMGQAHVRDVSVKQYGSVKNGRGTLVANISFVIRKSRNNR